MSGKDKPLKLFCTICGSRMVVKKMSAGFDSSSGKEKFYYYYKCKKAWLFNCHDSYCLGKNAPIFYYEI